MIERPILFSAPMVRALLAGTKTQTRRVLKWKPSPILGIPAVEAFAEATGLLAWALGTNRFKQRCPYGKPGDRLWVRETWGLHRHHDYTCWNRDSVAGRTADDLLLSWQVAYAADATSVYDHWRPSIHMPRWVSRVTLEVTSIRVERLQDISEADAQAEGAMFTDFGKERGCQRPGWSMVGATRSEQCLGSARFAFANLWNQINGKHAAEDEVSPAEWDGNPWVWVVNFKRVEGGQ